MKAAAIALRELLAHGKPDDHSRDLVAFISAALAAIADGIETSVVAWEKRDYWLKADRFRLDWEWTGQISRDLEKALLSDDWGAIAGLCVKLGGKLQGVKIPQKPRIGTPWVGAWNRLKLKK
ncbi:MAG TPA: hypothetical protein VMN57_12430 [Anaerolineales bacterium]|nr:hypothetical protein [Anaerolineales bacterium]